MYNQQTSRLTNRQPSSQLITHSISQQPTTNQQIIHPANEQTIPLNQQTNNQQLLWCANLLNN